MPKVRLIRGDATQPWPVEDNSLDSIVTDPPYGIAFMGKAWDDKGGPEAYQAWTTTWAKEAYRTLKPGGFLLAFGATRMAHRMACGFEDAGFRIVDTIEWLYLTGFPKAQDIGKLFDKKAGAEREVIAENPYNAVRGVSKGTAWAENGIRTMQGKSYITAPATPSRRSGTAGRRLRLSLLTNPSSWLRSRFLARTSTTSSGGASGRLTSMGVEFSPASRGVVPLRGKKISEVGTSMRRMNIAGLNGSRK